MDPLRSSGISNVFDMEESTRRNPYYRDVIYTGNFQLVMMTLKPGERIPREKHDDLDQFVRIEFGIGEAILEELHYPLKDGVSVIIPAGTFHEFINTGTEDLKLYTIYSKPEHHPDTQQLRQP